MYLIDDKVLEAYASDSREIYVRATFNDSYMVGGEYIKTFSITDTVNSSDTLSLGTACSNKLELEMFMPPEPFAGLKNAKIQIESGIKINEEVVYTPLGIFFVDDVTSSDDFKSVKITAFDSMLKIDRLGSTYKCKLSASEVRPIDIIKDICTQAGIDCSLPGNSDSSTDTSIRTGEGVFYDTDGTASSSDNSVGITELIPIPAGTTAIEFRAYIESYNDPLRVVFYKNKDGSSISSYKDYSGLSIGEEIDIETGESWTSCQITPPTSSETLYMGFHLGVNRFDTPPVCSFKIMVTHTVKNYINSSVTVPNPGTVSISPRTMAGYMSGILGCNAKIDRNGKFTIKKYCNTGVVIPLEQQYMNGYQKNCENPLLVEYITTGSEPNGDGQGEIITVGSGSYGFNFENPYITSEKVANNILVLYKNMQIMPGSVKYRGNPSVESGDLIGVEDGKGNIIPVLVLSQTISVTGGMSATVESGLKTNQTEDFISTPSSKKVTQTVNGFIAKYQDIVGKLTGVNGGYVKFVYDAYGKLRAIAIPDADVELKWDDSAGKVIAVNASDAHSRMWVWSNGGLSYSNDGGATYEVALNKEGQIWAQNMLSFCGTIGGWNIEKNALYADYGDYRTYIQVPWSKKAWAFSTQKKSSNGEYVGNFYVQADGEIQIFNKLKLSEEGIITDGAGNEIISAYRDEALAIGYGYYVNNRKTWIEGSSVRITVNGGIDVRSTFTFNTVKWDGVAMPTIESNSDLFINVPNGKAIFLQAPGDVYVYSGNLQVRADAIIDGNIKTNSTIICPKGLDLNDDGYKDLHKSGNVLTVGSGIGSITLNAASDGIIQCNSDLRLHFMAASGTIPLVVNTSGTVTVATSSERYKENITEKLNDDLNPDNLYNLPIKQYNYKPEYKDCELVSGTQIGITAEDVDKFYPNACIYNENGEPESWQDRIMIPAMLKLIQEQKQEIESLKQRLDKIEKEQGDYNA